MGVPPDPSLVEHRAARSHAAQLVRGRSQGRLSRTAVLRVLPAAARSQRASRSGSVNGTTDAASRASPRCSPRRAEFRSRYGHLSNTAYIDRVYRNVLGRSPDRPGLRFWSTQLATGVGRGQLMANLSESTEYRVKSGRRRHRRRDLRGTPAPSGRSNWRYVYFVRRLASGASRGEHRSHPVRLRRISTSLLTLRRTHLVLDAIGRGIGPYCVEPARRHQSRLDAIELA